MFGNKKRLDQVYTRVYDLEDKNQQLKKEIKQLKDKVTFLNQHITKLNDSRETILYVEWNNQLWVLSVEQHFNYKKQVDDLKFHLYNFDKQISPPRHYGLLWIEPVYGKGNSLMEYLKISDFIVRKEFQNRGFGSLILSESLLWLAKMFGENIKMKGWLSPEDEKDDINRQKRDYLYRKFNFEINGENLSLSKIPLDILKKEKMKRLNK